MIYAGSNNLLKEIPVEKVKDFEKKYLEELNSNHKKVLDKIKSGVFDEKIVQVLTTVSNKIIKELT